MKNLLFLHYYERVKELVKDNYVNFIDISNHPKVMNDKNLFCDEVHKTLLGNVAVAEILNEYQSAGVFEITWNAENYNSGLYFVKCSTGSEILIQKILLIK